MTSRDLPDCPDARQRLSRPGSSQALSTAGCEVTEQVPGSDRVVAGCELAGNEVGDADRGERLDLLTYSGLVADDGDVARAGRLPLCPASPCTTAACRRWRTPWRPAPAPGGPIPLAHGWSHRTGGRQSATAARCRIRAPDNHDLTADRGVRVRPSALCDGAGPLRLDPRWGGLWSGGPRRCVQSSNASGSVRRPNVSASTWDLNGPASVQPRSPSWLRWGWRWVAHQNHPPTGAGVVGPVTGSRRSRRVHRLRCPRCRRRAL
jgi:hypothetical protein